MASRTTPLADRLRNATERTELGRDDVARLLGTNTRTVARWLAEDSEPRAQSRRRLLEILAVLELLSGVLRPQAAHDWLFSPNGMLEHHKPIDLLAEGDVRPVLGLIDALGEGVFV